jgi:hypothetical protein
VADGGDHRLQLRVDTELGENIRDVVSLGPQRDLEPGGDLLAVEAIGQRL